MNRLFTDPVADMVRDRLNAGTSWNEVVDGLRSALFHGRTEYYLKKGVGELQAEQQAYAAAEEAIPR